MPPHLSRGDVVDWTSVTNKRNKVALRLGRAIYPNFRLGVFRYVRVMYCFCSGEISVQLEDQTNKSCYIRLSEQDFFDFMRVEHLILPLLKFLDGHSVLDINSFVEKYKDHVKRDASNPKRFIIPINKRIVGIIQVNILDEKQGELELRQISPPGDEELVLGMPYKVLHNFIILRSGVYEYFSRILVGQVNSAVDCWRDVRVKTGRRWHALASGIQNVVEGGGEVMTPVYLGLPANVQ